VSKRRTSWTPLSYARRRSTDRFDGCHRRDRARDARGNMLLIDGGRAVAGLCYVDNLVDAAVLALRHEAAPGHAFNVSDGLDITWKEFTDGLAKGFGCPKVDGVCRTGWRTASASRSSTATDCAQDKRLNTQPLLSRQAVHVLGKDQNFSNRKAREMLAGNHASIIRRLEAPSTGCRLSTSSTSSPSAVDTRARLRCGKPLVKASHRRQSARSHLRFIAPQYPRVDSSTPSHLPEGTRRIEQHVSGTRSRVRVWHYHLRLVELARRAEVLQLRSRVAASRRDASE